MPIRSWGLFTASHEIVAPNACNSLKESNAMHAFGARLTAEEGQGMTHDITNRADRWANRAGGDA